MGFRILLSSAISANTVGCMFAVGLIVVLIGIFVVT